MAYVLVLETRFCGFESHLGHHYNCWDTSMASAITSLLNEGTLYTVVSMSMPLLSKQAIR